MSTPKLTYEGAMEIMNRHLGVIEDTYQGPGSPSGLSRQRGIIISDLHAPFIHWPAFARVIKDNVGADVCIVNGDIDDGYAVSRYIKYDSVPYINGLATVKAIGQKLSESFGKVIVISGNHDGPRFEKGLRDRLPLDFIQGIQFLTGGELDPVRAVLKPFDNVELSYATAGRHTLKWFHQYGDILVCHAEKYSSTPGNTLRAVDKWFNDFRRVLKLKPFRVVAQAHTHQLSWFPFSADRLLVETGCLAETLAYQMTPECSGVPQRLGYIQFEMVNGKVDIDSVRPRWLDDVCNL